MFGEELDLAENAQSAIMIESSTGEILYSKNANERMAPASMIKIMSLILQIHYNQIINHITLKILFNQMIKDT